MEHGSRPYYNYINILLRVFMEIGICVQPIAEYAHDGQKQYCISAQYPGLRVKHLLCQSRWRLLWQNAKETDAYVARGGWR